jgi:membrane fusion protein, multidrug efflux system
VTGATPAEVIGDHFIDPAFHPRADCLVYDISLGEFARRICGATINCMAKNGGKNPREFRISKRTWIIGSLVFSIVLLGAILYWRQARDFESTNDAYTTARVHEISSRVAGTVEVVSVQDNQLVKAGQKLVLLDPRDAKLAVDKAHAQLSQRKAAAEQAQSNVKRVQSDQEHATALPQGETKAIPKEEVEKATAASKAGRGVVSAAKADLAAAETALSEAELQRSYTTIVAPVDGVVGKKTVETGARVQPGQALMAVVEGDVWVLANFKETQLAKVRVGQHVDVVIDAVSHHKFSAHVDSLQPGTGSAFALLPPDNATGNFTKIVQRVPVKIVFDDLGDYRTRIVPGLSCFVKIEVRTGRP